MRMVGGGGNFDPVQDIPADDLAKIKSVAESYPKYSLLFYIAESIGLRIHEILSLDLEMIFNRDDPPRIKSWIKVKVKGGWVADVHLPAHVRSRIEAYCEIRKRELVGLAKRMGITPDALLRSGPLFCSYDGGVRVRKIKRLTRQAVWLEFRKIQKRAGITKFYHMHQFRHTCGTRLAEQTHDPYVVARVLNHKGLAMALRYCHTPRSRIEQVLEKNDAGS